MIKRALCPQRIWPVVLVALIVCLLLATLRVPFDDVALGSHILKRWSLDSAEKVDTMIVTTETRALEIPDDPETLLPSWTIAALHNHLYAKAIGAHFVYIQIDSPMIEGKRPESQYRWNEEGYCRHRTYGWRPGHFCKMPFVWHLLRTYRSIENLIYVDSDVVFRSPDLSVHRHLDQLSYQKPFGVLTNMPYDKGPCSGYWFMKRGREHGDEQRGTVRGAVEDFLLEWWNEDWKDTGLVLHDQGTLRRMMGGDYHLGKVGPERKHYEDRVLLLDEWSFELKSDDQLLLHVGHKVPDRLERLADAWAWTEDYPLTDRQKLRGLLDEMDVRVMDPSDITESMPLPGEVTFG